MCKFQNTSFSSAFLSVVLFFTLCDSYGQQQNKIDVRILATTLSQDGWLTWTIRSNNKNLICIVQESVSGRWVARDTVVKAVKELKSDPGMTAYFFHKMVSPSKPNVRFKITVSSPIKMETEEIGITKPSDSYLAVIFKDGTIKLDSLSDYVIYDQYGDPKQAGYTKAIDASSLAKGAYYISVNKRVGEFIKSH
jgi:hypothetical protein